MNSTLKNNLGDNLAAIKTEMSRYNSLSHVEFFNMCINEKLKNTLYKYNVETDQLSEYLVQQASFRVLKAITKIQKFDDKKVIYENMEGEQK